jgi:murein DD-endopeptidase MepM/ murein hydrolase activator NlpD
LSTNSTIWFNIVSSNANRVSYSIFDENGNEVRGLINHLENEIRQQEWNEQRITGNSVKLSHFEPGSYTLVVNAWNVLGDVATIRYPFEVTERFIWPVPGFYNVSCPFPAHQCSQTDHINGNHGGIDIRQSSNQVSVNGATVVAMASGTVRIPSSAGCNGNGTHTWNCGHSYGNFIDIIHDNGITSRYAHLTASSFLVTHGQQVRAGDTIATVGSSGRSTGAHLHFEILENGVRVNPLNFIQPPS